MAHCIRFVCNKCCKAIESWSDGNPYFFDRAGRKQYAYHPDFKNLAKCVGNDTSRLCLACGWRFMTNSFAVKANCVNTVCPQCNSKNTVDVNELENLPCPDCHQGSFISDPEFFAVS